MATINQISNQASVTFDGSPVLSNTVNTLLQLPPTILKAVDKLTARISDVLTYTITITNVSLSALQNLPFSDTIAAGATYVTDSFKVNTVAATPTVTNNVLTYTIPTVAVAVPTLITFQVTVVGGSN